MIFERRFVMSTQLKKLVGIVLVICLAVFVFAEQSDPNALAGKKTRKVTTRDPRTGKITTQEVEVTDDSGSAPAAAPADEVPMRTITTRDPQTGRTITQQVPADSLRGGGFGGAFDPEQRAARYQKQLAVPDEQWETIKPTLTRTLKLQMALNPAANFRNRTVTMRQTRPGQDAGDTVRSGAESQDVGNPDAEMKTAFDALLETTRNAEATDEQIAEAMQTYTQKRQELEQQLQAAQDELRTMLTIRQQAQLTVEGVLN